MFGLLREPMPPARLLLVCAITAATISLYCLGYSALAGRPESFGQSLAWAVVNILPWIPALEFAKRARGPVGVAAALTGGLLASLGLGLLLGSGLTDLGFEAWRRLPAAASVAVFALGLRWVAARPPSRPPEPLPLLPRQIEWVRAAGNYVELRAGGRTIVHRCSISAVHRLLAAHGFVRIHRSTLVRRDRIARVRPHDVVLCDGTHLPLGKRYRAALAA